MSAYFRRDQPTHWHASSRADSAGSTARAWCARAAIRAPATNLSERLYFRRVLATGKPYISAGLIGRRLKPADRRHRRPDPRPPGTDLRRARRQHPPEDGRREQAGDRPRLRRPPDHRPQRAAAALRPAPGREQGPARRRSAGTRAGSGVAAGHDAARRSRQRRRRVRDIHAAGLGDADRPPTLDGVRSGTPGARSSSWPRWAPACC